MADQHAEQQAIGRYRLAERLGSGTFATVWRGYDDELDVPVAIKVLADNWAHDPDVRARFVAEARLLRRVRDQRVIRVHDIGTLPDGRPYFVMDYADGGTVHDLIASRRIGPVQALRLGAEIARAVQVLHDHGVAHRDIKPGNLLLASVVGPTPAQGVVVADLGMAKSLSEASGYTVTVGTPAYMAPEQALGRGFDERADVYAVAAVTYALLAGGPPFRGSGMIEIAERARSSTPPPLGLDTAGAIDAELGAALSYDPADRPATAGQLAERLDRLADRLAGDPSLLVAGPDAPTQAMPTIAQRPVSTPLTTAEVPAPTRVETAMPAGPLPTADPAGLPPARPTAAIPPGHGVTPAQPPATTSIGAVTVGAILLVLVVAGLTWVLLSLLP